jgi:PAS domain S-box-containing protein
MDDRKNIELNKLELSSLKDHSSVNVTILDKNGNYVYLNKEAAKNLGSKLEELTGKTPFDIFPADVAQKLMRINKETLSTQKSKTYQEIYDLRDGKKVFLVNVHPCMNQDGRTEYTQWIAIDISHLNKVKRKLKESEQKYKNLFENSLSFRFTLFKWLISMAIH